MTGNLTRLVHGEAALENALKASQAMFGGELTGPGESTLLDIFAEAGHAPRFNMRLDTRMFGFIPSFVRTTLAGLPPIKRIINTLLMGGLIASGEERFERSSEVGHGEAHVVGYGLRG